MLTAKPGGLLGAAKHGWTTIVGWHRDALPERPRDPVDSAKPPFPHSVADLLEQAKTASAVDELVDLIAFSAKFRRHSILNARLIQLQRPGARAVATMPEWQAVERFVLPDAVPIIILWPFAPVIAVFDVEDTGPRYDRAAHHDPFMAWGPLTPEQIERAIHRIRKGCRNDPRFRAELALGRLGPDLVGSVARTDDPLAVEGSVIADAAASGDSELLAHRQVDPDIKDSRWLPHYRVTVNDRLTHIEHFVTLLHELGHIFCGHLGRSEGVPGRPGWPDRSGLSHGLKEIEAEAVAWLVASRAQIVTGSAAYLKNYVQDTEIEESSLAYVERAASHIEGMAKLYYGEPGPAPVPIWPKLDVS